MKKLNSFFAAFAAALMVFMVSGCSDSEYVSGTQYASDLADLYIGYSEVFDQITEALENERTVTAVELCNQAKKILDAMSDLKHPVSFNEDHKVIVQCCENEKRKIDLEKEYLDMAQQGGSLTDEQKQKLQDITDELSLLSAKSGLLGQQVDRIASERLETKSHNMVGY